MRMIEISALCLLLAACGNSPKNPLTSTNKPQKNAGPCRGDYAPISLFVPGMQPITDFTAIPAGTYLNGGAEFYAYDDQQLAGVQQAHFEEVFFDDASATIRSVCHTVIDPNGSAEYEFPALRIMTIPLPGAGAISREDAIYQIQNTRGKFVSAVAAVPVVSTTGFAGLMVKYTDARLYKLGPTIYELHGELRVTTVKGEIGKWIRQRINFFPAGSI